MTPYRERREKGHYHPDGETPQSIHSHHLTGLLTATKPASPQNSTASGEGNMKITKNTSKGI
jgi:hypothetical protein